jgi:anti-anti-sigma factor
MATEHELLNLVAALELRSSMIIDVDLSAGTFVDCSGQRSILKTQAYLEGRGCGLRLLHPQTQFLRVMELAGLGDILTVVNTSPNGSEGQTKAADSGSEAGC